MQKLLNWVDERLPVVDAWNKHLAKYYAPKNFNMWYFFRFGSMKFARIYFTGQT